MPNQEHSGQGKPKDKQGQRHGSDRADKGNRSGGNEKPRNPGNFANDPERPREAGQKGGQSR
jgi:general stress protein YciG